MCLKDNQRVLARVYASNVRSQTSIYRYIAYCGSDWIIALGKVEDVV